MSQYIHDMNVPFLRMKFDKYSGLCPECESKIIIDSTVTIKEKQGLKCHKCGTEYTVGTIQKNKSGIKVKLIAGGDGK